MWRILQLLLPASLMATLVAGMMLASSNGAVVEVKEELPIRAALERHASSPRALEAPEEEIYLRRAFDTTFLEDDFDIAGTPDTDIIETAAKFEKFDMFVRAVEGAGLMDQLRSSESITVFMPTNDAFANLPGSVFEELLEPENREALRDFVSGHIVSEKVVWSDLFGRVTRLTTIGGKSLIVDGASGVRVNGVRLELSDVLATNGVIHAVDQLVTSVPSTASVM